MSFHYKWVTFSGSMRTYLRIPCISTSKKMPKIPWKPGKQRGKHQRTALLEARVYRMWDQY